MKNAKNNIDMALSAAFQSVKEVQGALQLDPNYKAQAGVLAEVLEHLRTVDREFLIALLREADIARAEYRKDHGLPIPDLNRPAHYEITTHHSDNAA